MRSYFLSIILWIIIFCFIGSCTLVRGIKNIKYIKNEFVNSRKLHTNNQEIILVELTHFGQKLFYERLKDSITFWKAKDYRIYYEEINSHAKEDSSSAVYSRKKWRRINGGFILDRSHYESLNKIFKNAVVQPEWSDLGITETDLNADISLQDLIQEYERRYGEVRLDSCDVNTSLDEKYNCAEALKNKLNPIILAYRNEKVVEHIQQNNDPKIVVIYGVNHIKGLYKNLRKN